MPLPSPQSDESRDDFISRCMSDSIMLDEYEDQDQRLAVCTSLYADNKSLLIKSDDERIVIGAVYVPGSIDSDGETMTREAIQAMAHEFLAEGRVNNIDVSHDFKESGNVVVESSLARDNDPDFVPGTWVLGVIVNNEDHWVKIKKGELNGFSFAGTSKKQSKRVLVEIISSVSGETQKSADGLLPAHSHDFFIEFDDDGEIMKGWTSTDMEHKHIIIATDSTEIEMDHAHRINLED